MQKLYTSLNSYIKLDHFLNGKYSERNLSFFQSLYDNVIFLPSRSKIPELECIGKTCTCVTRSHIPNDSTVNNNDTTKNPQKKWHHQREWNINKITHLYKLNDPIRPTSNHVSNRRECEASSIALSFTSRLDFSLMHRDHPCDAPHRPWHVGPSWQNGYKVKNGNIWHMSG